MSIRNEKLRDLENVINEIISQLNAHFEFHIKSADVTLQNIYDLVLKTSKRYNIQNNV